MRHEWQRPESAYQLAGWASTLNVMSQLVDASDYRSVPKINVLKRRFFELCIAASKTSGDFLPILTDACHSDSQLQTTMASAGLIELDSRSKKIVIAPLARRAVIATMSDEQSLRAAHDRSRLDALKPHAELVTNFYLTNKDEQASLELAKQDTSSFQLAQRIHRIQSNAAFYIGYYDQTSDEPRRIDISA